MIDFQIVQAPHHYPGVCIDSSSDGPCVDTHYALGECHLYLNRRTIREAACTGILEPRDIEAVCMKYGLPTVAEYELLQQAALENVSKIADLEAQLAELAPVQSALARAVARYGDLEQDDEPVRPTARSRR